MINYNNIYNILKELKLKYNDDESLRLFCIKYGIDERGSYESLYKRVEFFIKTGIIIKKPKYFDREGKTVISPSLHLETVITVSHRCSQSVRRYFESVIPAFHFSTHIQNFFKNNVGKTYLDAIIEWYEEKERKKDPKYRTVLKSQFRYNQFIRDFFDDPANQGRTFSEAVNEWNETKGKYNSDLKYVRKL